ncbi:IQ domain-containing protein E [Clonorchis sinensis]|uniref:IQ domain-containing protein E n=1 Tax=Clonorchis sinensis TaxID=79923 RepID=A0A8T1M665_CLOSI|nr:IQ domain-containing protein E [Clonorchis sinensis]
MRRTVTTPNLHRSTAPLARSAVRSATTRKHGKPTIQQRPKTQGGKSFSNVPSNIPEEKFAYLSTSTHLRKLLFNEPVCSPRQSASSSVKEKAAEDFAEEISLLKKKIAYQNAENQALNARCRQLKDLLAKKEKELAQLNDPAENAKLLQTLGDNRSQTMRTFRLLHQRIYRLEERLQEKESEYNRLVTDMKFTRIDELRIQLEATIEEARRLQKENITLSENLHRLTTERQSKPRKTVDDSERRDLLSRISTMGRVIKGLNDEKQELVAKNQHLLIRMQQILRNDDFPNEDIEQELRHLSQMDRPPTPPSRGDPDLVARMIETTLADNVPKKKKALFAMKVNEDMIAQPESVECKLETVETPGLRVNGDAATPVGNFDSSPLPEQSKSGSTQVPVSEKEENSAVIIQHAWRAHKKYHSSKFQESQGNGQMTNVRSEDISAIQPPENFTNQAKEGKEGGSEASTFITDEEEVLPGIPYPHSSAENGLDTGRRRSLGSVQTLEVDEEFESDKSAN